MLLLIFAESASVWYCFIEEGFYTRKLPGLQWVAGGRTVDLSLLALRISALKAARCLMPSIVAISADVRFSFWYELPFLEVRAGMKFDDII